MSGLSFRIRKLCSSLDFCFSEGFGCIQVCLDHWNSSVDKIILILTATNDICICLKELHISNYHITNLVSYILLSKEIYLLARTNGGKLGEGEIGISML